MQEEFDINKNTSLVPIGSKEIVRLKNSIVITEKILKEYDDRLFLLSWDILFEHHDFFNHFFSTFYSFSERELIDFYRELKLGYEFTSPDIELEPLGVGQASYGLKYNRNIYWTTSLRELYSEKYYHSFHSYYRDSFAELPFDIKEQVTSHYHFEQEQHMYWNWYSKEPKENPEIENRYNKILFQNHFTNDEVLTIINKHGLDYFCNEAFVNKLNNKLIEDIHDFSLTKFYNEKRINNSFDFVNENRSSF
jgi:hypothetical protein